MEHKNYFITLGLLLAILVITSARIPSPKTAGDLQEAVLPAQGLVLPITWGDLGVKMVATGVIDVAKLENNYSGSGGLSEDNRKLLEQNAEGNLKIAPGNANFLLTLLWGFGLSNKNEILERGPMSDPQYGGAQVFASTGGWTLARGNAMEHYSKHAFVALTAPQQALVERVSKNIYRPCCDNPTYFPDCNHGLAMLGLLELMASQGVSEAEMYRVALAVNSLWFPDTYLAIAKYFAAKGFDWKSLDPKAVLGAQYSSASGYQQVLKKLQPVESRSGGSCSL